MGLLPAASTAATPIAGTDTTERKTTVYLPYRTVDADDLLGGVGYYSVSDKQEHDHSSFALDGAQSYVAGFDGSIWGNGALIVIDGVPRDGSSDLRASEVESITFLKSAAAVALYGSRAAKGALMISTKRGQTNSRSISVEANTGWFVPKRYPRYLKSWEYMTLYNEALRNDGLDELYAPYEIRNSYLGTNPFRYPDIDLFSSEYLKKAYNHSDATAQISGGGEKARFYTNVGLSYDQSLLNFGEGKNDNNLRFNVRGNVDFDFNDFLSALVDASAVFNSNHRAAGDFWGATSTLRPNRFTPLIPVGMLDDEAASSGVVAGAGRLIDGKYLLGGSLSDQSSALGDIYAGGYSTVSDRIFQMKVGLDFDFARWIEGLRFSSRFSIDYTSSYTESHSESYAVYSPVWYSHNGAQYISALTKYGEDRSSGRLNVGNSTNRQMLAFSAQFDYRRQWGGTHNLAAYLIGAGWQQTVSGNYHKTSSLNLSALVTYNFDHRYYADFTGVASHSARMAPSKRNAFSPAVEVGWRIGREDFMRDVTAVDELKLTAGAAILHTDLDFASYYMYQGYYSQTDGTIFGWKDNASSLKGTESRRGDNPSLGFAKRKEISIGLRSRLFGDKLGIDVNWFTQRMSGMPIQMMSMYPSWFSTYYPSSSFVPYVNFNEDSRRGIDYSVEWRQLVGRVSLTVGLTGTALTSRAVKREDNYEYDYQKRAGKPVDAIWGLQSDGLFHCQDDIDLGPASSFGAQHPGDIRYIDQNGDGIIDSKDEISLGQYSPKFYYGVNIAARWNGWTFSLRGTGNTGGSAMKSGSYFWVQGDAKYPEEVIGRWTPETARTATYPRLTSQSSSNNFRNSDYWIYSTSRFDLTHIQFTYDMPSEWFHGAVKGLRLFCTADNVLTISKNRKILETNIGTAPQCRYYSIGGLLQF